MTISDQSLIDKARAALNPRKLSRMAEAGGVGAALETDKGNVYTGVCIDTSSGIGFCAEHSAIAAMVTAHESRIRTIVAVDWDGSILPPCGRCREFLYQIDDGNKDTRVIIADGTVKRLDELLPYHWFAGKA